LVLLLFLFGPLEESLIIPSDTYNVTSEVIINETPKNIWNNIVEVQKIDSKEYDSGFFNSIGIPRPLSANVDKKELGGQRIGNFEGGLMFIETITKYEENKKVSFDIKIDPTTVKQKVFDQHVLNGNYFTFLDATYELTEIKNGQVKLTLSSRY
jgi:hypothetical protein